MLTVDRIPSTYEEAVQTLAEWHAEGETPEFAIYSCDDPSRETVRLIEVSPDFAATGRVLVFEFGRSAEFPFRSAVAQVTPQEWARIMDGSLTLPAGWGPRCGNRVWPR